MNVGCTTCVRWMHTYAGCGILLQWRACAISNWPGSIDAESLTRDPQLQPTRAKSVLAPLRPQGTRFFSTNLVLGGVGACVNFVRLCAPAFFLLRLFVLKQYAVWVQHLRHLLHVCGPRHLLALGYVVDQISPGSLAPLPFP